MVRFDLNEMDVFYFLKAKKTWEQNKRRRREEE